MDKLEVISDRFNDFPIGGGVAWIGFDVSVDLTDQKSRNGLRLRGNLDKRLSWCNWKMSRSVNEAHVGVVRHGSF